jgi:hypothetical protein
LIVEREAATGTQTVALSGIKFFFRITLPRNWKVLSQTKPRVSQLAPRSHYSHASPADHRHLPNDPLENFRRDNPIQRLHQPHRASGTDNLSIRSKTADVKFNFVATD